MSFKYRPKFEYVNKMGDAVTFTLPFPPEGDPLGESYRAEWQDTYTETGAFNRVGKYIIWKFSLTLSHLSRADIQALQLLYVSTGLSGESFKLFPNSDGATFYNVRIMSKTVNFDRIAYDENVPGTDKFYYRTILKFETTL